MFFGLFFIFFCSAFKINALPAGCPNLPDPESFIQSIDVQPLNVDEEEVIEIPEETEALSTTEEEEELIGIETIDLTAEENESIWTFLDNGARDIFLESFTKRKILGIPMEEMLLFPKNDDGLYQKMKQNFDQLYFPIIYNNERSEVALERLEKVADLLTKYLQYDEEEIKKNFCEIDSFLYSYFNRKAIRRGLMGGFSNCRPFINFTAPKISMYLADHPFVKKYYEKSIHLFEKVSRPFFENNRFSNPIPFELWEKSYKIVFRKYFTKIVQDINSKYSEINTRFSPVIKKANDLHDFLYDKKHEMHKLKIKLKKIFLSEMLMPTTLYESLMRKAEKHSLDTRYIVYPGILRMFQELLPVTSEKFCLRLPKGSQNLLQEIIDYQDKAKSFFETELKNISDQYAIFEDTFPMLVQNIEEIKKIDEETMKKRLSQEDQLYKIEGMVESFKRFSSVSHSMNQCAMDYLKRIEGLEKKYIPSLIKKIILLFDQMEPEFWANYAQNNRSVLEKKYPDVAAFKDENWLNLSLSLDQGFLMNVHSTAFKQRLFRRWKKYVPDILSNALSQYFERMSHNTFQSIKNLAKKYQAYQAYFKENQVHIERIESLVMQEYKKGYQEYQAIKPHLQTIKDESLRLHQLQDRLKYQNEQIESQIEMYNKELAEQKLVHKLIEKKVADQVLQQNQKVQKLKQQHWAEVALRQDVEQRVHRLQKQLDDQEEKFQKLQQQNWAEVALRQDAEQKLQRLQNQLADQEEKFQKLQQQKLADQVLQQKLDNEFFATQQLSEEVKKTFLKIQSTHTMLESNHTIKYKNF